MPEDDNDWTSEEAEALRALSSGGTAPAALEEKTVERLRGEGLLPVRPPVSRRWWLAAAAGTALFAAGLVVGSRLPGSTGTPAAAPDFVLLLYERGAVGRIAPAEEQARVEEYRAWAKRLRREGVRIRGERLEPETRWLGPPTSGGAGDLLLGGYFVVSARNFAAAVAIARTCPHLKHGGTIEVRAIAAT
jgi:hypothetical protein